MLFSRDLQCVPTVPCRMATTTEYKATARARLSRPAARSIIPAGFIWRPFRYDSFPTAHTSGRVYLRQPRRQPRPPRHHVRSLGP